MEGEGDRRGTEKEKEEKKRERQEESPAILLPSSRAYGAREELTRAQLPFLGR